ncbi:MAG: flagellar export protein FliJ [Limnohabitans sp.]
MKPQLRACWPVLSGKAKDKVVELQTAIGQLNQRLEDFKRNQQRVQKLYSEYREQEITADKLRQGMQATLNQRQFMNQLLGLMEKLTLEIQSTESLLAQQRKQLVLAELEYQKMEALAEQDQRQVQRAQDKIEQRQMDDLAVARFNLRSA